MCQVFHPLHTATCRIASLCHDFKTVPCKLWPTSLHTLYEEYLIGSAHDCNLSAIATISIEWTTLCHVPTRRIYSCQVTTNRLSDMVFSIVLTLAETMGQLMLILNNHYDQSTSPEAVWQLVRVATDPMRVMVKKLSHATVLHNLNIYYSSIM